MSIPLPTRMVNIRNYHAIREMTCQGIDVSLIRCSKINVEDVEKFVEIFVYFIYDVYAVVSGLWKQ